MYLYNNMTFFEVYPPYEHQFDNRKDFKEAWKLWLENHEKEVNNEKSRIEEMNYKGNIEKKLFKSVRYYYKKK